jgi:predicted nuclease of predicted toxin-antitoxin system
MTLFVDVHLPPSLAPWLKETFGIESYSFDYLGWRLSEDYEVFVNVREYTDPIIITKDEDFVRLLQTHDSPPKIIWVTMGNTSNQNLRRVFIETFRDAMDLLRENDLVEING